MLERLETRHVPTGFRRSITKFAVHAVASMVAGRAGGRYGTKPYCRFRSS